MLRRSGISLLTRPCPVPSPVSRFGRYTVAQRQVVQGIRFQCLYDRFPACTLSPYRTSDGTLWHWRVPSRSPLVNRTLMPSGAPFSARLLRPPSASFHHHALWFGTGFVVQRAMRSARFARRLASVSREDDSGLGWRKIRRPAFRSGPAGRPQMSPAVLRVTRSKPNEAGMHAANQGSLWHHRNREP